MAYKREMSDLLSKSHCATGSHSSDKAILENGFSGGYRLTSVPPQGRYMWVQNGRRINSDSFSNSLVRPASECPGSAEEHGATGQVRDFVLPL